MKLTSLLLATALTFGATGAFALEVTHPFFGPSQGQFSSVTDYSYARIRSNAQVRAMQSANETVGYGITDNWTVKAGAGRNWIKDYRFAWGGEAQTFKTDIYGAGMSYNVINDGKAFLQIAGQYRQVANYYYYTPDQGEFKEVIGTVTGGYNFNALTVYGIANFTQPVFQKTAGSDNEFGYDATVAAYKRLCAHTAVAGGFNYAHTTQIHSNTSSVFAQASYLFNDNFALTGYGSYVLDNNASAKVTSYGGEIDKGWVLGAKFSAAF